ncbi:hypothetical protein ANN_13038 [Periplaneta americana]|uniref:Tc1-like transposase DDE domain-containing protein n=1 Tax=Periplaneta americana TaxID=6978 RepID=A0ABQ8TKG1_PERAM|nr:hypothetical protein ANN_13038 [Periplaneta americana]
MADLREGGNEPAGSLKAICTSNLQSSVNAAEGLGTTSLMTIYVGMSVSSIFLPVVLIKWLGCKWTLVLTMVAYIPYIVAQVYARFYTLIPAAFLVGMGAGPLWRKIRSKLGPVLWIGFGVAQWSERLGDAYPIKLYETDYMIADCTPDVHGEAQLLHLGTMDNLTPGQEIITNGLYKIGTKFYSRTNAEYALYQIIIHNVCAENQWASDVLGWHYVGSRTQLVSIQGMLRAPQYRDNILQAIGAPFNQHFGKGFMFMDDNSRIHRAAVINDFHNREGIARFDWPTCSPGMNPIEHVWVQPKRAILARPEPSRNLEDLCRVAVEEWGRMDQQLINVVVDSMPRRVQALSMEEEALHSIKVAR